MRDPAATVIEPAFTSPTMTPPSSTSTRLADSILPCSSPPTTTMPASTWPVRCAPASILKLPSIRTSPLKRPAIRTFPDPSILPSIVRFAAMTDSPPSDDVLGVGRRGETASAGSLTLRSGKFRSGGGADGGAIEPAVAGGGFSFPSAMSYASIEMVTKAYTLTPKNVIGHCLLLETVALRGPPYGGPLQTADRGPRRASR